MSRDDIYGGSDDSLIAESRIDRDLEREPIVVLKRIPHPAVAPQCDCAECVYLRLVVANGAKP